MNKIIIILLCNFLISASALKCYKKYYCRCSGNIAILNRNLVENSCNDITRWSCNNCELIELANNTFDGLNVYELTLDNNNITELDWMEGLLNVTSVSLLNNSINVLRSNVFVNQDNLLQLDLRFNDMSDIESDSLRNLGRLKYLYLSYNNLQELPDGLFQDNVLLQTIDLSSNILTILRNDTFMSQNKLYRLDLRFNNISMLEVGALRNTKKLTFLYLDYNIIEELPYGLFEDNSKLAILDLSFNRIRYLQNGVFDNLTDLYQLYLRYNELRQIETEVFRNVPNLHKLYLDNNDLYNFDCYILLNYTKNIKYVTLDNNQWDCSYLEYLLQHLVNNNVTVKSGYVHGLSNINGIHCDRNNYVEIEENMVTNDDNYVNAVSRAFGDGNLENVTATSEDVYLGNVSSYTKLIDVILIILLSFALLNLM